MKLESNDVSYNLNKWNHAKHNILFVTGLSGSGKSTISDNLHKETKCEVVHLDDFRNNQNTSTINFIEKFEKEYPETKEYFEDRWSDNRLFEKYFILYLNFVLNYIKKDKTKLYVVEGIQIYCVPYRKEWFSNKPLIIKGTDVEECYKRQIARGSKKLNDKKRLEKASKQLSYFKEKYLESGLMESREITNFMRNI